MRIAFWYRKSEPNSIARVGIIGEELTKRGHKVSFIKDDVITTGEDVIVIDDISPSRSVADRAIESGAKVVVLDGKEMAADVSISGFANEDAKYKGAEYVVFPKLDHVTKYNTTKSSNTVFVCMGPQDKNNYTNLVLEVLDKMEINAIVAGVTKHNDLRRKFSKIEIFSEDNYYEAMHECIMAVTDGGTALFQALHYGMPTIAIAQDEHQSAGISLVEHCCVRSHPYQEGLQASIKSVIDSEYYRTTLSDFSKYYISGSGTDRICEIIEGLGTIKEKQ